MLKRKGKDGAGKGKGKQKGKEKTKDKSKDGKGKGESKAKKPVDDIRKLSRGTRDFHRSLVAAVPGESVTNGEWKQEILNHVKLTGEDRVEFLEHVFSHVDDLAKGKNKWIYIGPGRDGSSDDKIAIDCKFNPWGTGITFSKVWEQQGFVKTTYAYTDSWKCIGCQAD